MSKTTRPPAFRSPSEFVRAANDVPTPLSSPPSAEPAPAAPTPAPEPKKPRAARPAVRQMTGTDPLPWAAANERVIVHFGLRMPETLHAKLSWLQKNSVNATMHAIALAAVQQEVDRRIAELIGPGKV